MAGSRKTITFVVNRSEFPPRQQLISETLQLVYIRADKYRKEYNKDNQWTELVSIYAKSFITGSPGSTRLDETVKRLVRTWVNEARTATGLEPPTRSTKKKRK